MGFAGFLIQAGITVGAVIFSHGQLTQRVKAVEEKQREHGEMAESVTRLEVEMESISREIKQLRESFARDVADIRADFRRVLDEVTRGLLRDRMAQ